MNSLNCSKPEHIDFCMKIRVAFQQMKLMKSFNRFHKISLDFDKMTNATLDIIFDFFGSLLKNVLIKKEIELQKILRHSAYGQSGKIPSDLCLNKLDTKTLCNYLQPMMNLIRSGANKEEFYQKYGFVLDSIVQVSIYKDVACIGNIIYDWKRLNNHGAVSIICRLSAVGDIQRALLNIIGNDTIVKVRNSDEY